MWTAITDRLDGLLNPILLKEVRQGFRGRGLLLGAGGALLFSLGAFALFALDRRPEGGVLFVVLSSCMGVMMLVIIPLGLGWQLQKEIGDRTLELIAITNLGPWQNVGGRLLGGATKLLLTVALTVPFLMGAVLLGGVGFGDVLLTVGFYLACAVVFCAFSLMLAALSTMRSNLVRMVANVRFLLVPLAAMGPMAFAGAMVRSSGGSGETVAFVVGWLAVVALSLTALFLSAAADLLTPPWVRSYGRSKGLAALATVMLASAPAAMNLFSLSVGSSMPPLLMLLSLGLLLIFSMFWAGSTLPDVRPRRAVSLPRDPFLSTVLYAAVVGGTLVGLLASVKMQDGFIRSFGVVACVYFLFFGGVARLLRRVVRRRHPAIFPGTVVALTVLGLFVSIIVKENGGHAHGLTLLLVPIDLFDDSEFIENAWVLLLPASLGLAFAWLGRERSAPAARAAPPAAPPEAPPPAPAEAPAGHG